MALTNAVKFLFNIKMKYILQLVMVSFVLEYQFKSS